MANTVDDMNAKLMLLANFIVALFMTGVIWYVQVAHYPLFANVGQAAFPSYHVAHNNATTLVVALPMLIELGLSFGLLVVRPDSFSVVLAGVALAPTLVVWACTFFVSVPLHGQLGAGGLDVNVIAQLVNTNWVRTLAWTGRAIILGVGVAQVMRLA
jgi:hypothetical protein